MHTGRGEKETSVFSSKKKNMAAISRLVVLTSHVSGAPDQISHFNVAGGGASPKMAALPVTVAIPVPLFPEKRQVGW